MAGKWAKIIAWVLIVLTLVGAIGAIAYFTGGLSGEHKSFYIEIGEDKITSNASGYEMTVDEPITVNVKYSLSDGETSGYTVKVVPNVIANKDFDFKLDDDVYSYQAEKDLTAGFEIEYSETSFTIKPKGGITEILEAVYPNNTVEDCRGFAYENMFTLVVTSFDGESSVSINFSIPEGVWGIELDQTEITF